MSSTLRKRRSRGFTLVEVLASAAIMLVFGSGLASLMISVSRNNARATFNIRASQLGREMVSRRTQTYADSGALTVGPTHINCSGAFPDSVLYFCQLQVNDVSGAGALPNLNVPGARQVVVEIRRVNMVNEQPIRTEAYVFPDT